jgi:hypothetical protein
MAILEKKLLLLSQEMFVHFITTINLLQLIWTWSETVLRPEQLWGELPWVRNCGGVCGTDRNTSKADRRPYGSGNRQSYGRRWDIERNIVATAVQGTNARP